MIQTFLEEVTFVSHGGEHQGTLFPAEQPGGPSRPIPTVSRD